MAHDLPPALSGGLSPQLMAPFIPDKSQFLSVNAGAPTQTISVAVLLFCLENFLPDTIRIKATNLFISFHSIYDHPLI